MAERDRPAGRLAGALTALAAVLLALGTFLPRWWAGEAAGASMAVGLRHATLCGQRGCAARGLDDLGDRAWALAGATGFAIGCVAVVSLLAAAALAATGRGGAWRPRVARAAAGLSLFTLVVGCGFAWAYPGFAGLSLGAAPFLYLGGAALGVGAAGLLVPRAG